MDATPGSRRRVLTPNGAVPAAHGAASFGCKRQRCDSPMRGAAAAVAPDQAPQKVSTAAAPSSPQLAAAAGRAPPIASQNQMPAAAPPGTPPSMLARQQLQAGGGMQLRPRMALSVVDANKPRTRQLGSAKPPPPSQSETGAPPAAGQRPAVLPFEGSASRGGGSGPIGAVHGISVRRMHESV
eukprot:3024062-Prymnesium_polylepis.1